MTTRPGPLRTRPHETPDILMLSLCGSATAEALQAIIDLDPDALIAIVPPRGYGRD